MPLRKSSKSFSCGVFFHMLLTNCLLKWPYSKKPFLPRIMHCVKSVQIRSFFLVRIFLYSYWIWDWLRKSPYSVQTQETADQKKLSIWTLFTQWWLHTWERTLSNIVWKLSYCSPKLWALVPDITIKTNLRW